MAVRWADLTRQEQEALLALSQRPLFTLRAKTAERLKVLGLAEQAMGGMIITAVGRELIWKPPVPRAGKRE